MLDRGENLIQEQKSGLKVSSMKWDDDDDEKEDRNKSNYDLSILTAVGFKKCSTTCSDSYFSRIQWGLLFFIRNFHFDSLTLSESYQLIW